MAEHRCSDEAERAADEEQEANHRDRRVRDDGSTRGKPARAATTRMISAVGTIFATSVEPPRTTIAVSTSPVAPSAA
jgi:hypothetical protein